MHYILKINTEIPQQLWELKLSNFNSSDYRATIENQNGAINSMQSKTNLNSCSSLSLHILYCFSSFSNHKSNLKGSDSPTQTNKQKITEHCKISMWARIHTQIFVYIFNILYYLEFSSQIAQTQLVQSTAFQQYQNLQIQPDTSMNHELVYINSLQFSCMLYTIY